jgi:hypothetical protein
MLKPLFRPFLALALVLFLAAPVLAQPPADDDDDDFDNSYLDYGPVLTPEQTQAWDKIWKEYQDKAFPIQSQLGEQWLLYRIVAKQSAPSLEEARKIVAEISRLKGLLRTEQNKFQEDLKAASLPEELGIHARGGFMCGGGPGFGGHGFGGRSFGGGHGYDGGDRSSHGGWGHHRGSWGRGGY